MRAYDKRNGVGCFAWLIILAVLIYACSCTKGWEDIEIPSSYRMVIVSQRFTDPPAMNPDKTWRPYKTVRVYMSAGVDSIAYTRLKPDTTISSCSIDKVDSAFKIEVRSYAVEFK